VHRRTRNRRSDFHHKTARTLVNECDVIALEDLRVVNMTRSASGTLEQPGTNVAAKSGLNKSILDAGWSQFASILAGKAEIVTRLRRNPLFRALRVDKLTITALEVTLAAYQRGALDEVPTLAMIRISAQEMERRSRHFIRDLTPSLSMNELDLEIADGESLAGGGSTPAQWIPTKVIRIKSRRYSASQMEQRLRRGPGSTPVVARIDDDRLVIDLRTVFANQETALAEALAAALR